tara:strand:+ start:75 stop:368 length:294 start_codon:yes stop_codon:yes gene_type:complete
VHGLAEKTLLTVDSYVSFAIPSTMLIVKNKLQLLNKLNQAVENDDREAFCDQCQMGAAYFDQETVTSLLSRELPLLLGDSLTERMHSWMGETLERNH